MENNDRTKEHLLEELAVMHHRIAELEKENTKRKQVEEALKKSEAKIRSLTDNVPAYVVQLGREGIILFTNRTYEGISMDEVVGTSIFEWLPEEQIPVVKSAIAKVIDSADIQTIEYTAQNPQGEMIWYSARIGPIITDGQVSNVIFVIQDISKHKKTQEKLRKSEERYRNLVETSQDLIFKCDKDGCFTFLNQAWETALGYKMDEMLGHCFSEFKTPEQSEKDLKIFKNILEGQDTFGYETVYISKSGEQRNLVFNARLLKDEDGNLIGTQGTAYNVTDRKKALDKLKESEEKYRQLVLTSTDAIMLFDADTKQFLDVNKACEHLYGYSKEEFLKLKHDDITDETEESKSSIDKTLNRKIKNIPLRYHKKKDGTVFPVEIAVSHFEMEGHEVLCGVVRDITERKLAEEELRRSKILLEASIESPRDMIILSLDREYRYLSFNKAHTDIMGHVYDTRPRIGDCIFDHMTSKDDIEKLKAHYDRATAGEGHVAIEEYGEDQLRYYFEIRYNPIYDEKNKIIGVTAFAQNITERKKAEAELKEKILLNKILMDSMPCVALLLRTSTREIIASNEMAEKVGAVPGKQCFATWGRSDKPCPWCCAPELWETGKAQHEVIEGLGITWDAHWIPVSEDLYMHFAFDITERKRTEEELQKMQKLESIGILAGGIAHDFNNLLAAIRNNIYLAMMHVNRENIAYENLESTENIIHRAANLTQQLLTFSKGGLPIKKTASIIELIKESAEFVLKGSNVKCEFEAADNLRPAEVDEGQINQVIHNLILNADQSMPEGGTIKISAENINLDSGAELPIQEGKYVKVVIQDQGIGISEENLKKIFDPYFTTKEMGRGLGLSITYSIIKNHNGHISVESEIGAGTAFTIYLPASEKQVAEKETVEDTFASGEGKVLIMDDEEIIRESVEQLLTYNGYEVECAKNGDEAIELYKKAMEESKPFDAVILDLTIRGGMGGKEVVKKLLEIDPNVRAIVASGYSNDPVLANFKDYGFVGVFAKHDKTEELGKALYKVIKG